MDPEIKDDAVVEGQVDEAQQPESRREAIEAAFAEVEESGTTDPVVDTKVPGSKAPTDKPDAGKPDDKSVVKPNVDPVVSAAPASWKPAQKEKWKDIDPEVRQEIIRRERETAQVVNDNQRAREFTHSMAQVIGPHAQRFQAMGVQPQVAVERLLRSDLIMSTAAPAQKAHFFAKMIKDYGVDIGELDKALDPATTAPADPNAAVSRLVDERLAPVNQELARYRQRDVEQETAETQRLISEVDAMEANPEKYPYFSQLRGDMADIIELSAKKGVYLSTEAAYNKAIGFNPEVAALNQARIQAETKRIAAVANNARAQRAKSASLSVAGSSSGKPTGSLPAPSDRRGTIAAALDALEGR